MKALFTFSLALVLALTLCSDGATAQPADPPMIIGSYGSGPGQFRNPYGVDIDSAGNIYVVDELNHRMQKFDVLGNVVMTIGPGGTGWSFSNPHGVMVDDAGTIYVANLQGNRILWFDPNGTFLGQLNIYQPYGMDKDSAGNIWVCGWAANEVYKFDPTFSSLLVRIPSNWFYLPGGVGVDAADDIYVADTYEHIIRKFDPQGNHILTYGSYRQAGSADGQFGRPHGIAVDRNGNTYVADTDNHRVQKFDSLGVFQWKITGLTSPTAVGLGGPNENILAVAEAGPHQVRVYNLPLEIGTATLPDGIVGEAYSAAVQIGGGVPPYAVSIASGALPNGIGLDAAGNLTGTPTQPGTYALTVQVTDSATVPATVTQALSLGVYRCVLVPSGLIAWWNGSTTGTIAHDIEGANDGTMINETSVVAGKVGSGFRFDGSWDYVSVPDSSLWTLGTRGFTIELWASWDRPGGGAIGNPGDVLIGHDEGGGQTKKWFFALGGGVLNLHVNNPGQPGGFFPQAPFSPVVGQWYHLAITRNASTFTIYIDGASAATATWPHAIPDPAVDLTIGRGEGFFMHGRLDEVSIYNRALSGNEISDIYDAGPAGKCKVPPDTTPPTVAFDAASTPDGAIVNDPSVYVKANVTDDAGTTVSAKVDGVADPTWGGTLPAGGGSVDGTVTLPLVDGEHEIAVSATDDFNNTGGTMMTVTLDTTLPVITSIVPAEGMVLGSSPQAFDVTVADASVTTVTIGATAVEVPAGGGTATFPPLTLAEGSNAIVVSVVDAAGNVGAWFTRTVFLDLNAPTVSISSPTGVPIGGASSIPFQGTVNDDSSTTSVLKVNGVPVGAPWSSGPGGGVVVTSVTLVEGANTIELIATDAVNLTSSALVTVVYDTTPPDLDLGSPSPGEVVGSGIDISAIADDPLPGSGVASVVLMVDTTALATFTATPYDFTLETETLADGSHTVYAIATDGVGNAATTMVAIVVDSNAPVIAITEPLGSAIVAGEVKFEADVTDAGAGLASVTMQAGGAPPTTDGSTTYSPPLGSGTCESVEDTTLRPDGPLELTVLATDAAGNEATALVTVTIDNTAPDRALVSPTDGAKVRNTIEIHAVGADTNLKSIEIKVDGQSIATSTVSPLKIPFDTTTRLDGAMVVEAIVTDQADNQAISRATVTVNNIRFKLSPRSLNLKSKGKPRPIKTKLEGLSLPLMLPLTAHTVELRVPGGSPVPATPGSGVLEDRDEDNVPDARVLFDRDALIASIKAGIAAGKIKPNSRVEVELVADGFVIGTVSIRIKGK